LELPERLVAEGHRVRAIRLPGHGTSPPPARDMVDTTGGDLLEALVREAGVLEKKHDRVVLVGHSMGAR
jgi:pimeloyl-ACP methyl ester carboxylesterase